MPCITSVTYPGTHTVLASYLSGAFAQSRKHTFVDEE